MRTHFRAQCPYETCPSTGGQARSSVWVALGAPSLRGQCRNSLRSAAAPAASGADAAGELKLPLTCDGFTPDSAVQLCWVPASVRLRLSPSSVRLGAAHPPTRVISRAPLPPALFRDVAFPARVPAAARKFSLFVPFFERTISGLTFFEMSSKTYKALVVTAYDANEPELKIEERPIPTPATGEVLVRITHRPVRSPFRFDCQSPMRCSDRVRRGAI